MTSAPVTEDFDFGNFSYSPTVPPHYWKLQWIFYAVVNALIVVLGVGGNALVMWISGFKIKKSVNSTWYLSLAVSDLMFCSFLFFSIDSAVKDDWIFGSFMCKFMFFILLLNWNSSILLLVIISVERCVAMMFPVWAKNHRTVRKASVIVLLIWIISAVLSLRPFFILDVQYDSFTQKTYCLANYTSDEHLIGDVVSRFVILFVIPFLIIIFCYVLIFQKLKRNRTVRSNKPIKIMTLLIVAFLICWLPVHIFSLLALNYWYTTFMQIGFPVANVLAHSNSCINPFLYAFMGKDFKNQCHALLSKIENAIEEEEEESSQNREQHPDAATASSPL